MRGTDKICERVSGNWHESIDTSWFDPNRKICTFKMTINHCPTSQRHCLTVTCEILASTAGQTCKEYCEAMGRSCFRGQDNAEKAGSYRVQGVNWPGQLPQF